MGPSPRIISRDRASDCQWVVKLTLPHAVGGAEKSRRRAVTPTLCTSRLTGQTGSCRHCEDTFSAQCTAAWIRSNLLRCVGPKRLRTRSTRRQGDIRMVGMFPPRVSYLGPILHEISGLLLRGGERDQRLFVARLGGIFTATCHPLGPRKVAGPLHPFKIAKSQASGGMWLLLIPIRLNPLHPTVDAFVFVLEIFFQLVFGIPIVGCKQPLRGVLQLQRDAQLFEVVHRVGA